MKIYLCGGMHNGWQDFVIALLPQHILLDPRQNASTDARAYTAKDLSDIREADAVLAYMDADNPSGYGLNLEIGYAAALNKPIYLAIEPLGFRDKYFGMARSCARVYPSLHTAILAILEAA